MKSIQTIELNKLEEVTVKFSDKGNELIEYKRFSNLFGLWLMVDLDLYERSYPEEYNYLMYQVEKLELKTQQNFGKEFNKYEEVYL